MIWYNFSIFRTNFAIAYGTHNVDFCGCRAVEMASEIIKLFFTAFGLRLNTFMSAGILLEYFRKVLKFK